MLSSVIYHFSCGQCPSDYVSMTSRNLYMRIAEHAGRSYRSNRNLASPPHSSIRDHTEQCNVPITLDNFKILDYSSNSSDLRILESLHIFKTKPSLNLQNSSYPL